MKDFSKEIEAYALQNAIEFGKADPGRILPKLFQHGLEKYQIKDVMPVIQLLVRQVNSLSQEERKKRFETFSDVVKKHIEEERGLPELPGSKKGMVFRIAPFPSGALHIGNAKTLLLNALYAEKYKGALRLVIDDTIGSEKKQPIFEAYGLIEDAFTLLGVKYKKPIIYKSDRLKIYYKFAEKLIDKNKAYVCHCSQETLRENRMKGIECSCRQYPVEMQKKRWKDMFKAKEGAAILRIKTNMGDPNPAFRDRVLFKISDREHPRVKHKYRVWPSLEMTWAIDDHELGITHIIRGNDLMIETDMEKYIWDIFGWKHPVTIHSGLIKLEGTDNKTSKSKSQKEIREGTFTGWDDPRTWSIQSLIKRGIRKEAIREFVEEIGLNKQDITVPIDTLYAINRRIIDLETARYSFVPEPIELSIKELGVKEIEIPLHPEKPKTRKVKIGKIYVSKGDYEDHKGEEVRLLHLCNIQLGKIIRVTSYENKKIPKIQWVSEHVLGEVLMPDGTTISGAVEKATIALKVGTTIQFERFGFVTYQGTRSGKPIFWFAHK